MHLEGSARKAIFITGGASGIGRATAKLFASRGWFVGLADVNEAGLIETAALLPKGQSSTHVMDVRNRGQWEKALADFWKASGGRLDILFNNAGIARGGPFETVSPEDHDLVVDINFKGVVIGAETGLPWLKQTPGSCLLNSCSAAGIFGLPGLATYSATKFAVRGLTEALNLEWEKHGIAVRSIMPSFSDTPLLDVITTGTKRPAHEGVKNANFEFTPAERIAEAAWKATHGKRVHTLVGTTAWQLAFAIRWLPWLVKWRCGHIKC
jgi:NAD(P)-dependent dehydrogenase (short-subunit alcohol dehydrogenase family)